MVENWMIPCNKNVFDIDEYVKNDSTIVWKNTFSIKTGDIVYIYVGEPEKEIKYKGTVIADEVSDELLEKHSYARIKQQSKYLSKKAKYIQIRIENSFKKNILTYEKLKEHGLGQVQRQARIPRSGLRFIKEIETSSIELVK